ncbi:MAG: hypothetical protein ONB23_12350 [candidate division KSB1 bacterium]|nr:hypothetical protein [candidate division KSB1 bacterium]
MIGDRLLTELDRRRLMGVPIWHFALRSLFQPYGLLFLREVVLAAPDRFACAFRRARRIWEQGARNGVWRTSPLLERFELLAPGYCLKAQCPVGRFSHRCLYAEGIPLDRLPHSCGVCPLPRLIRTAIQWGACFYIMTSAADVARDLFIPNLRSGYWRTGLFFLCPYSAWPFLLGSLAAGIEAELLTFHTGCCSSYQEFLSADRGLKEERTDFAPHFWRRFGRVGESSVGSGFRLQGNVYWPTCCTAD